MNLAEKLAAGPAKTPRNRIDAWIDARTEDERAAILAAAVDPDWPHTELYRVLSEEDDFPKSANVNAGAKALAGWRQKQGLNS